MALGLALSDDRVERLVALDSFGLGTELPRGRLSWAVAQVPALNRLSVALLRRSEGFRRASLEGLVADSATIGEDVHAAFAALLQRPDPGHALRRWRSAAGPPHGPAPTYPCLLPDLPPPVPPAHTGASPLLWFSPGDFV